MGEYTIAEQALQKAIERNPFHGSSHFLLGNTMLNRGFRVQSMLAYSQFLFLENLEHPINFTSRAKNAYKLLREQALGNIERTSETSININLSMNDEDEFGALNTILSLMGAQDRLEADSLDLNEAQRMERFYYTLNSMMSETNYDENSFWGKNYAQFFSKLGNKDLEKAYVYVVLLPTKDSDMIDWINKNTDEIEKVEDLLIQHYERDNK